MESPDSEDSEIEFHFHSPENTPGSTPLHTPPDSILAMVEGTVADLTTALTNAFKNLRQYPDVPLPQFSGKKGENPEDHCMKVEDHFKLYLIEGAEDQCNRFKDTCVGKVHRWISSLDPAPNQYTPDERCCYNYCH